MIFTDEEIKSLVTAIGGYNEGERYVEDTMPDLLEKVKKFRLDSSRLIDLCSAVDQDMIGYESALVRKYGFTKPYNTLFARYDTLVTLWHEKNKIMDKKWDS